MNGLITVLLKECRDNIRDRRTILSSFSLALFGPALFIGLMTFMLNTALGESDEPVSFAVVGADHAPGLVAFPHQQNTSIFLLESVDAREEVTSGRYELRLRLRQQDEKPGSTVRYGELRYPAIGIDVIGLPRNTQLAGENGENPNDVNDVFNRSPLAVNGT